MKKYIAVLLVVISCLFAFSGCSKKDEYYVDPDTVTIIDEILYDNGFDIWFEHTNNFAIIVAIDVSCFDKNNSFLGKCYGVSDYAQSISVRPIGHIQNEVPNGTTRIEIDKIIAKKSFFDEKYHRYDQ